jgi:hypothetical protein
LGIIRGTLKLIYRNEVPGVILFWSAYDQGSDGELRNCGAYPEEKNWNIEGIFVKGLEKLEGLGGLGAIIAACPILFLE